MKPLRWIACVAAGAASALLPGCADLDPVAYDAGPAVADAGPADVVANDAYIAECRQCLVTGACASVQAACLTNMSCASFFECMTSKACWASASISGDLTHLAPCLLQCGAMAGFTSSVDPGSMLASPLIECAQNQTKCGSVCAPGGDN
jgi:hypothetical protein